MMFALIPKRWYDQPVNSENRVFTIADTLDSQFRAVKSTFSHSDTAMGELEPLIHINEQALLTSMMLITCSQATHVVPYVMVDWSLSLFWSCSKSDGEAEEAPSPVTIGRLLDKCAFSLIITDDMANVEVEKKKYKLNAGLSSIWFWYASAMYIKDEFSRSKYERTRVAASDMCLLV